MKQRIMQSGLGLMFGLVCLLVGQTLHAQPVKGIQNATKSITQPMKEVQGATKTVTQPIKETKQTVKTVTNAPKQVTNEVKATEKAIDNAGKEITNTKKDIDKAVDKVDGDKKDDKDSTAKADANTQAKPVVVDQRTDRDKVRDGSGYGDENTDESASATMRGDAGATTDDESYRRVLLPPSSGKTTLSSTGGTSGGTSTTAKATPSPTPIKPKPDYSGSAAREALESADFAMETLQDLFDYAVWEGPDKDHTLRSVDYMLKQLRHDIDEIRQKDPDRTIWHYEQKYKEWRNIYLQNGGK